MHYNVYRHGYICMFCEYEYLYTNNFNTNGTVSCFILPFIVTIKLLIKYIDVKFVPLNVDLQALVCPRY